MNHKEDISIEEMKDGSLNKNSLKEISLNNFHREKSLSQKHPYAESEILSKKLSTPDGQNNTVDQEKKVMNLMERSNGTDFFQTSKSKEGEESNNGQIGSEWPSHWIKLQNPNLKPQNSQNSQKIDPIIFPRENINNSCKAYTQTLDLSNDSIQSEEKTKLNLPSKNMSLKEREENSNLSRANSKKNQIQLKEPLNMKIGQKGPKERDFEVELKSMEDKYKSLLMERDEEITKLMELNTNRGGPSNVQTLDKIKGEKESKNPIEKPKLMDEDEEENQNEGSDYILDDKENYGIATSEPDQKSRVDLVRTFKVEVNDL